MPGYFSKISAQLDLDITPFERGLASSAATAEKFGGSLEHKLLGPRHVMGALATALGLNIEKIGEHLGELLSGITEKSRELYKEIEELSTEAADKQIENMRRTLSEDKKLALLQIELERLRRNGVPTEERGASFQERALLAVGPIQAMMGSPGALMTGLQIKQNRLDENALARSKSKLVADIKALELEKEIVDIKAKQEKESAEFDERHEAAMEVADESLRRADDRMREFLAERKKGEEDFLRLKWEEVDAEKALAQAQRDRSASTLGELAGSRNAPGRVQAREVLRLEKLAKRQRMMGVGDDVATLNRADAIRGGIRALSAADRNPLQQQQNAILSASQKILDSIDKKLSPISIGTGGQPAGSPPLGGGITSLMGNM